MKNIKKITDFLQKNGIFFTKNENMCNQTSIKIGGKVDLFVQPNSQKQLVLLLNFLKDIGQKFVILGNGTNTLFSDNGFDGVVISSKKIGNIKITNNDVIVSAGVSLFPFLKKLREYNLKGLEFAYGIPGSVGGAVVMNAGAFNQNVGDFVEWVKVWIDGKVKTLSKEEMNFSYRSSLAQSCDMVILSVKFNLENGTFNEIKTLQEEYFNKRLQSQPYSDLSFGSVFKRNLNFEPVSKLIDELGLKGYRIGGAEISEKHAGFIINIGSATCQDCLKLIKYIQQKIFDEFGFVPEPEVKVLGDLDADIWGLSHTHNF